MKNIKLISTAILLILHIVSYTQDSKKQLFLHPGGLHTQADLDRMKAKVAEGAHPWIEGWNILIKDHLAQNSFVASPKENMNIRQVMSKDAHAAYLNAIRWYISGDESYAKCAIRIFNDYSSIVNQIPSGGRTDIVGLGGIGISELAIAAEIMRIYSGWKSVDFDRFKVMMINYFYPVCHDFLVNHNGACIDYYWANWDANNITALIAIGVLCDNQSIYDEGIEYFKYGAGAGSIKHAIYYIHEGNLGQWQESGRDQEHGQLGVGLLGTACQIAWNQGNDLFGYDNNRLLAGAEYTAKYNQMQEVPFKFYNNCQPANHKWPAINGRGRLDDRPVWEMLYNHYVIRQGLCAPNVQRMAELMRPEHGSKDHFGYGSLTFTLEESSSTPHPIPGKSEDLKATAGVGKVFLTWQPPSDFTSTGYVIQRAESIDGNYDTIGSWYDNTCNTYTDNSVSNGTKYYYKVAALNQSGIGEFSSVSSSKPQSITVLPSKWKKVDIGANITGSAEFADVAGSTFIVSGNGNKIGDTEDNVTYCYTKVSGDYIITCRISDIAGSLAKSGLMIRETLKSNSSAVTMTLGEVGGRFSRMGYRNSTGADMLSTLGNTYTWLPAWFRLERKGNTFTAYESSNSQTWFKVKSVEIPMFSSYYIGLAVVSQDKRSENKTTFDNFTLDAVKE
ncbi:alginate lyase family protein [Labilibaculum sp. K2S]|uniref:alginate lyase family protein n=1 Tax=Labilibaculum sp. K2S TaxID=3056386 RepID=UPI0025A3E63C|nr:alginate lyase family protein [Labilibaculum sp. K2S]MDM8159325.1 alginate lyase family protein [Labilibaculum sp. K2S]